MEMLMNISNFAKSMKKTGGFEIVLYTKGRHENG